MEDSEKPSREFLKGLLRGAGLALPGIGFAVVTMASERDLRIEDGIKVAGAILIIIYSLMGFLILNPRIHRRYSRVALASFSFFTLVVGVTRLMQLGGFIDYDANRVINTIVAITLGSILAYVVYLHYLLEEFFKFLDGDEDA